MSSEGEEQIAQKMALLVALGQSTLREVLAVEDEALRSIAAYGQRALADGYFEVAKEVFEGLIALDPRVSYFYLGFGCSLRGLGEKKGAFQAFEKAKSLAPEDVASYLNQSQLLMEDKRYSEARQLLQQIRKLDPRSKHPLTAVASQLLLELSQIVP